MSNELPSCTFVDAARNHLHDSQRASVQQRWDWLCEAMDSAVANARARAQRGLITLDANRQLWWSPALEQQHFPAEAAAVAAAAMLSPPESAAPSPT